jgi:hypothetical protein
MTPPNAPRKPPPEPRLDALVNAAALVRKMQTQKLTPREWEALCTLQHRKTLSFFDV